MKHAEFPLRIAVLLLALQSWALPLAAAEARHPSEREIDAVLPRLIAGAAQGGIPQVREVLDQAASALALAADGMDNRNRVCGTTVLMWSPSSSELYGDQYTVLSPMGRECRLTLLIGDDARELSVARIEMTASNQDDYVTLETAVHATDNGWLKINEYRNKALKMNSFPVGRECQFVPAHELQSDATSPEIQEAIRSVACRPQLWEKHLSCTSLRHLELYRQAITEFHINAAAGTQTTLMIDACPARTLPSEEALADLEWLDGPDGKRTLLDSRYCGTSVLADKAKVVVLRAMAGGGMHFEYREAAWQGGSWSFRTLNHFERKPLPPTSSAP